MHETNPRTRAAESLQAARDTARCGKAPQAILREINRAIRYVLDGAWNAARDRIRAASDALGRHWGAMPAEADDEWVHLVRESLAEASAECTEQIQCAESGCLDLDDAAVRNVASGNPVVRRAVDRVHARHVLRSGEPVPVHMLDAVKAEAIRESEVSF